MPHDCDGTLLSVGDRVSLMGTVVGLGQGDTHCNATIAVDVPENVEYAPQMAINSRAVRRGTLTKMEMFAQSRREPLSVRTVAARVHETKRESFRPTYYEDLAWDDLDGQEQLDLSESTVLVLSAASVPFVDEFAEARAKARAARAAESKAAEPAPPDLASY